MNELSLIEADPDPFALDVEVVTDLPDGVAAPCATDNGCAGTCASSCASRG
jgi:FxLD family lantipeptide